MACTRDVLDGVSLSACFRDLKCVRADMSQTGPSTSQIFLMYYGIYITGLQDVVLVSLVLTTLRSFEESVVRHAIDVAIKA